MTRKECLDEAAKCVLQDRNSSYGGPEDSFGVIANFWSVYLGKKVYPHDVAMMMSLLKIARITATKDDADGYVDLAGYAACGAECASGKPAPKSDDEVVVLWKHKPEGSFRIKTHVDKLAKAEGCESLVVSTFDEARMRESMPGIVPQDAPQTPKELCDCIVANNPVVFGRAHKPTGEELAEMAGGEAHE